LVIGFGEGMTFSAEEGARGKGGDSADEAEIYREDFFILRFGLTPVSIVILRSGLIWARAFFSGYTMSLYLNNRNYSAAQIR